MTSYYFYLFDIIKGNILVMLHLYQNKVKIVFGLLTYSMSETLHIC